MTHVKEKHVAPFTIRVHYVAHCYNLAFMVLSNLGIFATIKKLLSVAHAYFGKCPKQMLAEFTKFKGLKMLKNV